MTRIWNDHIAIWMLFNYKRGQGNWKGQFLKTDEGEDCNMVIQLQEVGTS